jgi:hypothetical protein
MGQVTPLRRSATDALGVIRGSPPPKRVARQRRRQGRVTRTDPGPNNGRRHQIQQGTAPQPNHGHPSRTPQKPLFPAPVTVREFPSSTMRESEERDAVARVVRSFDDGFRRRRPKQAASSGAPDPRPKSGRRGCVPSLEGEIRRARRRSSQAASDLEGLTNRTVTGKADEVWECL